MKWIKVKDDGFVLIYLTILNLLAFRDKVANGTVDG